MRVTIIATGFDNKEAENEPAEEPETQPAPEETTEPEAETPPEQPAEPEQPEQAQEAAEPVPEHAPKYDSDGEDSSISEDDFDTIMSIFRSKSRRDRNGR